MTTTERPLSEVASDGTLAERFRTLILTAIFDRLRTTGVCHADDLIGVYPEGHVDLCRNLATAHFGQLARRRLIQKTEWRKSTAPGRNGGGSWVWKFTKAGWDMYGTGIVGVGDGGAPASGGIPHSGDRSVGGRGFAGQGTSQPSNATPDVAEPETLFDLGQARKHPRSAITDPDWGDAA